MNNTLKKTISGLTAAALLFCLGGCGTFELTEEETAELEASEPEVITGQSIGQVLEATFAADNVFSLNSVSTSSFNPYTTTSAWNQVVDMLVYENLLEMNEDFSVSPNLVTSWTTEDGMSWTFSVDTERSFHDGGVMTAADAVYSIEQAMAVGGKYETRFSNVKGISAVDTSTFAVSLEKPDFLFYCLLNVPCIEYGTGYSDAPPGTGVYQFGSDGSYLLLDTDHPKSGSMPLKNIYLKQYAAAEDILQAFEDSYLDLVINNPTGMATLGYSSSNIIKYVDTSCLHYLGYNMNSRVFSQSMFRVMMTYAIDRAAIVSDAMKGAAVAAVMPVHPNSSLYPEAIVKGLGHSEDSFRHALANVGAADLDGDGFLELGGQKTTVNFIVCSDSAAKVSAARIIAGELGTFGLAVDLRELSYEDYIAALEEGNFDIYYAEVKLCPDWDLTLLLTMDEKLNYGGVRDGVLTGYIQSYLASGTEEELNLNSAVFYQYLGENAPITAICFEKTQVLYHRGVLYGLSPTQDNIFRGMENWTVTLN